MGLIPAHAGKTCTRFLATFGSRAHPRSRGENLSGGRVWPFGRGSSPLTRGKPSGPFLPLEPRGLIPAHAGKTHCRSPRSAACPAHPRSRGENYCHISRPRGEPGSSPLTRGKRRRAGGRASGSGLIPAHAGKTPRWRPVRPAGRAHPRSRGENGDSDYAPLRRVGSSPLTRGKPGDTVPRSPNTGLIPAHAGKTRRASSCGLTTAAHPRSRGENSFHAPMCTGPCGSSPLTRGKLRQ